MIKQSAPFSSLARAPVKFLSVLNLGELQKGISKLPEGAKKDELQAWIGLDLVERFTGRILDIDLETVRLLGTHSR